MRTYCERVVVVAKAVIVAVAARVAEVAVVVVDAAMTKHVTLTSRGRQCSQWCAHLGGQLWNPGLVGQMLVGQMLGARFPGTCRRWPSQFHSVYPIRDRKEYGIQEERPHW